MARERGIIGTVVDWVTPSVSPGSEKPKPEKPGGMGYNAKQGVKDRNAATRAALQEADPEYQKRNGGK